MSVFRRITYTSRATYALDELALLDILHDARAYNEIDGITGVLLHDCGQFLQVIEGPEASIRNLIKRLQRDTRHEQFHVHEDVLTPTRLFEDWKMGFGDLSDERLSLIPCMASESEQNDRLKRIVGQIPDLADELNQALALVS